jgi:hypothetical protein
VSATVVRVGLVSLSPTERDASNSSKSVFRQRLIFSLEGFANSVELMRKALQGSVDAGAVIRTQRRQPTVTPITPPSDALAEKPRAPNGPPNFAEPRSIASGRMCMTEQSETCLHCLVSVARHHGIELSIERLRHTYAIANCPIPQAAAAHSEEAGWPRGRLTANQREY